MHQANVVNPDHEAMDDMAEWAADHPITRRPFIPQGCTQQGRLTPSVPTHKPAGSHRYSGDAGDDFRNADGVFWRYAMTGGAVWAGAIALALFR